MNEPKTYIKKVRAVKWKKVETSWEFFKKMMNAFPNIKASFDRKDSNHIILIEDGFLVQKGDYVVEDKSYFYDEDNITIEYYAVMKGEEFKKSYELSPQHVPCPNCNDGLFTCFGCGKEFSESTHYKITQDFHDFCQKCA